MPIVDGKYEARISTTFATPQQGTAAIQQELKRAKRVRISNVPMPLLRELVPLLRGKDVMIILPTGEKPSDDLKELGKVAVTKGRIYKNYKGVEALAGAVYFSDVVFSVAWAGDEILEIATMEYSKCVKCMKSTFDVGWHYAQK